MPEFWGHSRNGDADHDGVPELLRTHIEAVSQRAEVFASAFGVELQAFDFRRLAPDRPPARAGAD